MYERADPPPACGGCPFKKWHGMDDVPLFPSPESAYSYGGYGFMTMMATAMHGQDDGRKCQRANARARRAGGGDGRRASRSRSAIVEEPVMCMRARRRLLDKNWGADSALLPSQNRPVVGKRV